MTKNIVFALVAVMMVAEANAAGTAVTGARPRVQRNEETNQRESIEEARARGHARSAGNRSNTATRLAAEQVLLSKFGMSDATQRGILVAAAEANPRILEVLRENVTSRRSRSSNTEQVNLLNDAQAKAVPLLGKIADLAQKAKGEKAWEGQEELVYNLVVNAATQIRNGTFGNDAAAINKAIQAMDVAGNNSNKTIAEAMTEVARLGIDLEKLRTQCRA